MVRVQKQSVSVNSPKDNIVEYNRRKQEKRKTQVMMGQSGSEGYKRFNQ